VTADEQLLFAGPGALAALVRDGEVHPRELVESSLRRIEALDPQLNAFRVTLAEQALAAAEHPLSGALAGVPIAIKDDQALAGQPTTYGSRARPPAAPADSEVVRKLRAAGAIPVGITNVPELMIWPWTASDANGITRNPWDPSRTTGGSSGGSAAAVAAGMVPVATASDGGGSIRIPAAACGLVGMKPSRGRVSTAPAPECWLGLSVFGALTRTVADSALLLDVIQGALPSDADRLPPPAEPFAGSVKRSRPQLTIGISRKLPPGFMARLSRDQRQAWDRTARLLDALGHNVVERDPSYGLAALEFVQTWFRGVHEDRERLLAPGAPTATATRQMSAAGRVLVPPARRAQLREQRQRTTARILRLWQEIDVLLTPGLATTAIAAEGAYGRSAPVAIKRSAAFTPWTPVFNLTGQPAVALPAGFGADGLPLSVQLVGRPGEEGLLYALAAEIESAEPWPARPPMFGG
jgi:amidase